MGIIYKNGIAYGNQPNGTVPSGGTTGQVLKKASNTDYDTEWANESGSGGTSDYTQLSNKPQINGNTLTGNQTGAQLGLVDAVTGKQLSTEDYTTAEKTKLAGIEAQANKTVIDDTLTNTGEAADAKAVGDEISDVRNTLNSKADQDDITSLNLTGTTNTTGSQIDAGTYFYLNGSLVKAKVNIASGATFTDGTNYEAVTAGGLNSLKNESGNGYCKMSDGTLIQWGMDTFQDAEAGSQSVTINFPISFFGTPIMSLTWRDTTAVSTYMSILSSQTHSDSYAIVVAKRLLTGYSWVFQWIAIGRWK